MTSIEEHQLQVINYEDRIPDWKQIPTEHASRLTKLVLGKLENDVQPARLTWSPPTSSLAELFPNLTHLYLWGIEGLTELTNLPPELECLDFRGCVNLTKLKIGAKLKTLDLGDCASLTEINGTPQELERVYLNGCTAFESDELMPFLKRIKDSTCLREFDASGCPALQSLKNIPRSVEKLVLKDCSQLDSCAGLGDFSRLRHLNLAGCSKLISLPDLPATVQFLKLTGADSLNDFMGQGIGQVDRENEENVASLFHSRKKFGAEIDTAAYAKLLFLGDGRVGKSTLAKRLQYQELKEQERKGPRGQELNPSRTEPPTHGIRFWNWKTELALSAEAAEKVNTVCESRHIATPCDANNQMDGTIRIWDFGGQEIYHQTHRLFASAGSVFLICWSPEELDEEQVKQEAEDANVSLKVWKEMNRRRSLDYWFDYVDSICPGARVALVCTHSPHGKERIGWETRCENHKNRKNVHCFYVDSANQADCDGNPHFMNLVGWIREQCGSVADEASITQPKFFIDVAQRVDEMLEDNQKNRDAALPRQHLLLKWEDWEQKVRDQHATLSSAITIEPEDIHAITKYLHGAGHLFYLHGQNELKATLIDQSWATDLIYGILAPGGALSQYIEAHGGLFEELTLEQMPHWQQRNEFEKQQLLSYMQTCGIVARLGSESSGRDQRSLLLATEKWLLPPFEALENRLNATLDVAKERGILQDHFSFESETLSEFDFRSLIVSLAKVLGLRGTYFREGLQATDNPTDPTWCFRLKWKPMPSDDFLGKLDATLAFPNGGLKELPREIEAAIYSRESPLQGAGWKNRETNALDWSPLYFRIDRDDDYDIAVSSRGSDQAVVDQIIEALRLAKLRVTHYREKQCREGKNEAVLAYMHSLRRPKLFLACLSDSYFEDDPDNTWYCPYELADALVQIKSNKRTAEQTLVVYLPGQSLNPNQLLDKMRSVFTKLGKEFGNRYNTEFEQSHLYRHYEDRRETFATALQKDVLNTFWNTRGTNGSFPSVKLNADGTVDCTDLIERVRKLIAQSQGD
jgi:GTPase SAR1 family protein